MIAYNTKTLGGGKHPRGWAEFWDAKAKPAHRAMQMKAFGNLEIALVADGVAKDKLYPVDIERAFKKLDQLKPNIDVWPTSYDQPIRLLTDGKVDVAPVWNARASAAAAAGAPDRHRMERGLPLLRHVERSQRRAQRAGRHAVHQLLSGCAAAGELLGPLSLWAANMKAIPLLAPEQRAKQPTAPENLGKQIVFNDEWWASRLTRSPNASPCGRRRSDIAGRATDRCRPAAFVRFGVTVGASVAPEHGLGAVRRRHGAVLRAADATHALAQLPGA